MPAKRTIHAWAERERDTATGRPARSPRTPGEQVRDFCGDVEYLPSERSDEDTADDCGACGRGVGIWYISPYMSVCDTCWKSEPRGRGRPRRPCDKPGCDRPHYARGMCRSCYDHARLHGDGLDDAPFFTPQNRSECLLPGCDRPQRARGLCYRHYSTEKTRARRARLKTRQGEIPSPSVPVRLRECTTEGCEGRQLARGMCRSCYGKWHYRTRGR